MADSKRQKLVTAIVARMATILTTNGYETSVQNVADWNTNWQQPELPAISVCDMTADTVQPEVNPDPKYTIWLMPVQIRIYAEKSTTPANVRKMIQDVNKAIRGAANSQDDRWPVAGTPVAMQTRPLREGFIIPEDDFEVVGAVVEIEIAYKTQKFETEV